MRIGIIAALDYEMELFCSEFNAAGSNHYGVYEGKCSQHEVFICLSGVGKVNAAANTQRLIDLFDIDCVICSGVAGCTCKQLGICDIAVSTHLTYHDFPDIYVLDKYAPHTSVFKADEKMVSLAMKACEEINKSGDSFRFDKGMIVTGDEFIESKQKVKDLQDKYNCLCTEMEGAAVGHVCVLNSVPFVAIRAMSDNADEEADMTFDEMSKIAAKRASFVSSYIISNL